MALGMKDLEFAFNLGKEHMIEKIKEILMTKDKSYKIHGTTVDSSIDMPDSMDVYDRYGDWVDNVLVEEVTSLDNEEPLPYEPDGHHSADAYKEMALEEQLEDLEKQLDEIYESVVGDEGRERYTHEEFIQRLLDIYDDSQIFQRMEDYRDKRVSSD